MPISKKDFGQIVGNCWSKETALDPANRSQQDPSYSHDLLTALLANEMLNLPVGIEAHTISDKEGTVYHFLNNDGDTDIYFCNKSVDRNTAPTRKAIMDNNDVAMLVEETKEVIQKRYDLLKKKFEKQLYDTIIDGYIQDFINERFDNIDDLPKKLLLPNDPNYDKYKCRTVRRTNISIRLQMLPIKLPSIRDATKQEIKNFQDYIKILNYSEFRTKEEIDKANTYLENIITLLRAEKSIQKLKGIVHKKKSKRKEKENQI